MTVEVTAPYDLTEQEIRLEPPGAFESMLSSRAHLQWLMDTGDSDEELERVFRSTTVLKARFPEASFKECLKTAIIWERG